MRWLNYIIAVLIITLINAGSAMGSLTITELELRPNLLIALLAYFAYISDKREVIIASFMTGFMADISGATMGPSMIAFGIVGVSFAAMRDVLIMERRRNKMLAIFLMSIAILLIVDMLTTIKTGHQMIRPFLSIPLSAVYTAVIGAFLWTVLEWISAIFGVKRRSPR